MLIEVMISALLVALIVTATFNGFDAASRLTADARRHAQAELLAAESQEALRTEPASALDALESSAHTYTKELGGTKFTIKQTAKPVSGGGSATGCSANEKSKENGANIQISSEVTWALLEKRGSPPVTQTGIITPPVGSALEVDVTDGGSPGIPSVGVTATAKFTPVGSALLASAEGTTGSAGCVVLTGLATTLATVEIAEKQNFVTTSGTLKYPNTKITIAPNITTQDAVSFAEGARINAEFTYKGETVWGGKPVTGNTFVVFNEAMPVKPKFETGSQEFKYESGGEEKYTSVTANMFASTASTAFATKYSKGDLFPFPKKSWSVYAGDCPNNGLIAESVSKEEAALSPGTSKTVKVPMSYTSVSVKKGTYQSAGAVETTPAAVKITNTECEGYELPANSAGASLVHTQNTTTGGVLENPFQPFGKAKICVLDAAAERTYTASYNNANAEGSAMTIFFGQRSPEAIAKEETEANTAKAKREAEESAAKTAKTTRETEEANAKTAKANRETEETEATKAREKREKEAAEEKTAKETREAKEATERKEWEKKLAEKKLTEAEYKTKIKNQETTRKTAEATEKSNQEKRAEAETAAKKAKEKRESEETAAATAKTKRETEEAAAKVAKEKRATEETEATKAREAREKETAANKEAYEKDGKVTVATAKTC